MTASLYGVQDRVRTAHRQRFATNARVFAAPGRVNLIGEHTDYNDGFVLPMAVDRWTVVASSPNNSDAIRVRSLEFDDEVSVPIDTPFRRTSNWYDYAAGVVAAIAEEHPLDRGLDVTVGTDLPIGGGLSSSASFELALAQAIVANAKIESNADRLAAIGRRAEHEYVGIRSGAMDQVAVAQGVADSALFIDCRTLAVTPVAIPAGVAVAVMDTGVRRTLAASQYNERRKQCERCVELLREDRLDVDSLRDVTQEMYERHAAHLPLPIRERARHVIEENGRTKAAVAALGAADVVAFGRLMNESHVSLRDYYDVSIPELDELVSIAQGVEGVYGARMTGGGFGGCAIALVDEDAADRLIATVSSRYYGARTMEPAVFITEACGGAHELDAIG